MIKIINSLRFIFRSIFLSSFAPSLALAADEGTCPPLSEYISEGTGSNFLLNNAFEAITKSCSTVANISWNAFAEPLQAVVVLGAAIYIAVFTLKNIGSFSQQDFASYFSNDRTGIIPLMVKVAVVVILLTGDGKTFMYGSFIAPIVSASMNVGASFGDFPAGGSFSGVSDVSSLFSNVLNKIRDLNGTSYKIVAMGRELMCLTFMPDSFLDKFWILLPFGVLLFLFGWFLCIGIAFYMLDVLFRLAVGCMILPIAIACGVSKLTSTYTQKTWMLFVNVCFNFMTLGIVADFSTKILENAMGGNTQIMSELTSNAILTEAQVQQLCEHLSKLGFTKGFVLTILCTLVIYKLFTEVEKIAENISGTSSVGSKSGAQVSSATVAKGAIGAGKKLRKGVIKSAANRVGHDISNLKPVVGLRAMGYNMKKGLKSRVKKVFRL
ncbi:MAG: hypothetical protein IKW58_02475 [Alphaproteobacteria bacterium]|nr:hypothetical protein [Alphaproteobacteria bacterium]